MVELGDADYSKHFSACAEQARRCAALMASDEARRALLQIATTYENLARTVKGPRQAQKDYTGRRFTWRTHTLGVCLGRRGYE